MHNKCAEVILLKIILFISFKWEKMVQNEDSLTN